MKKFYVFFMIFSIFICIYSMDKDKKELINKARNYLSEKYNIKPWHFRLSGVNKNYIGFKFYLKNYIYYLPGIGMKISVDNKNEIEIDMEKVI